MNALDPTDDDDALTPAMLALLEQACDRFAAAWKAGKRPVLEDYLSALPPGGHPVLFRELLALELAYRHRAGERPGPGEYRERFPEYRAAVDVAWAQPDSAPERPLAADSDETTSPEEPPAVPGGPALAAVPGPTVSVRPPNPPPDPLLGSIIASRYKLRQEIGEGGMGSVYHAVQMQPVKRQVALKLIKAGMDSRTVLARFESERQALALMDHPNIAKVLDAGATEDRRPFFVMELVKGVPLTEYCDQHRLGLPERLALFRQICSAVHHAHQKGIIHRDLKPTNILVESHDGHPVPKVIDFGLAKATSGLQLSEHSLFTAFGTVAGTPLYMAPEQASFNALDVDTRADIYSLGVILYELLTGSTPIRRESIQRAALDEILRVIRDVEPPTPSSRISTSEALPAIAATRQTEPARLGRFVRGDLDWIVMKALAKERQRRYESAIALAQDVERFTNHEPVSAGPPTAMYRLRKFVRRNRPQVVAASFVLLALIAGIIGTTLGLLEARRQQGMAVAEFHQKEKARRAEAQQRRLADEQRRLADEQRRLAVEQRRQAEKRLSQIEKANAILGSIFKDLNPYNIEDPEKPLAFRLGERLDQATAEIEGEAIGDSLTVARMQMNLGACHRSLNQQEKAAALFSKARATFMAELGPDHPETLESMERLALAYRGIDGKAREAMALFEESLRRRKATLGPDHPDTLSSMDGLASVCGPAGKPELRLPLLEEVYPLRKAKLGNGDRRTLISMAGLALAYQSAGQLERALPLLEEVLELRKTHLGPDHPDTLGSMNELANGFRAAGDLDRAVPLYEKALALQRTKLGPEHVSTIRSMENLAHVYRSTGKRDQAMLLFEQALAVQKAKLGVDHAETLTSMHNLALGYLSVKKPDRAVPLLEHVLTVRKAKLGPDHRDTIAAMGNLGEAYRAAGQLSRALPMLEEVVAVSKAKRGPDDPGTLANMNNLANACMSDGQISRAVTLYEETLALQKAKLGPDHPNTLTTMNNLAYGYKSANDLDRALPLYEETLALRKAKLGPDHPDTLSSMNYLALGYLSAKEFDRALPLLQETLTLTKARLGPDHTDTLSSMNRLASGYKSANQLALALPLYEETLALRKVGLGPDHPDTLNTMKNLAECSRSAGKLDRALPLYEELLALQKAKLGLNHSDTLDTMNGLATCYWSAGKLDRSIPLFEECLRLRTARSGPNHSATLLVKANLGVNYKAAGRLAEALPLLQEASLASRKLPALLKFAEGSLMEGYLEAGQTDKAIALAREQLEAARTSMPAESLQLAGQLALSGMILLKAKVWNEAEPILREALAIRESKEPGAFTTCNAKSMLGGALLGQEKYADAEPLLRAGYEGMKLRAETFPMTARKLRLAEALDRLIELAEATNRPDEVRMWKDEKANLPGTSGPKE
jgi:serine/threonine protein kinase